MLYVKIIFQYNQVPSQAEVQLRLAYVSCVRQLEEVKNASYCDYIRPPIDKYGTLQFEAFEEIRDVGYYHGQVGVGYYHGHVVGYFGYYPGQVEGIFWILSWTGRGDMLDIIMDRYRGYFGYYH